MNAKMSRSKMSRSIAGLLVFGAVLALAAVPASARWGRGGPGVDRLEDRLDSLGLDDATRAKINGILDQSRADARALRAQMRPIHQQIHTLLQVSPPDEAAVLAQVDQLGALQTQAHKQHIQTLIQVLALLSPDQRQSLQSHPGCAGPGGYSLR